MGSMRTLGDTGGRAQVKVWVDEGGKVTKAAVEDADNKNLAEAALAQARATVYQPYMENGRFVGFETVFEMNIAVGVGMGFPIGSPAMGGPTPNIGLGHP
jgi:TonB family protein